MSAAHPEHIPSQILRRLHTMHWMGKSSQVCHIHFLLQVFFALLKIISPGICHKAKVYSGNREFLGTEAGFNPWFFPSCNSANLRAIPVEINIPC